MTLENMLHALNQTGFEGQTGHRRYYGLYVGKVTNINDPDKLYRIQVTLPMLHTDGEHATYWARTATWMAGPDRGFFCMPEVDDEVIVAFIAGDDQQPIVMGSLWNGKDKCIGDSDAGKNHRRWWKTRSGHIMEFNDNDKDKKTFIKITTTKGHIFELNDLDGDEYMHWIDKSGKTSSRSPPRTSRWTSRSTPVARST
jgi:hypothetical protein